MDELSYKHIPDDGLIEIMLNGKLMKTWVCDGVDPKAEFAEFETIYNLGKSSAVMEFVNTQIGAFETGFVNTSEVSLYSLYRFAQLHVKDNYKVDVPMFSDQWSEDLEAEVRSKSEIK